MSPTGAVSLTGDLLDLSTPVAGNRSAKAGAQVVGVQGGAQWVGGQGVAGRQAVVYIVHHSAGWP